MLSKQAYFGMYLGQKVIAKENTNHIYKLERVELSGALMLSVFPSNNQLFDAYINDYFLQLRTFEDMTEEEMVYMEIDYDTDTSGLFFRASGIEYLIEHGIDVFGLIEKGYAVRESEAKK